MKKIKVKTLAELFDEKGLFNAFMFCIRGDLDDICVGPKDCRLFYSCFDVKEDKHENKNTIIPCGYSGSEACIGELNCDVYKNCWDKKKR